DIINRFTEWSIRSIKTPSTKIDKEIQEYFETVRTQFAPKLSLEERIVVLEKRIQDLENTPVRVLFRFIGGLFRMISGPSSPPASLRGDALLAESTESKQIIGDAKTTTQAERDKKPRIAPFPIKSFADIIRMLLKQENDSITFNSVGGKLSQYLEDEYGFTTKQFLILEGLNENLSIRRLIINQLGDDVIISEDNKEVELNRRG
ncbi:uncharacterized protein METZ01_LOCUS508983, partial [marine metagenome]